MLENPQDAAELEGVLYVTGQNNAITKYDQITKKFLGYYHNFSYPTEALEIFEIGGQTLVGVVLLYNGWPPMRRLAMLDFNSSAEVFSLDCPDQCWDMVQNPLNNSNILVATSYEIEQYSWNGTSLVFEGTYLNFADVTQLTSSSQSLARMHWHNSKLYVAFSNPPEVLEFTATSLSASCNGQFVGQPGNDQWSLKDFAFLNDTSLAIAGNAFWYTGYLFCYNTVSQSWSTLAESNYTQGSLVGMPERLLISSANTLYVLDFSWISTWNSSTFAFKGSIEFNEAYAYPFGVTYNPLGDPSVTYVSTGNRILEVNRRTGKPAETFLWKAIPDLPDGLSISRRTVWRNNTMWIQSWGEMIGYDANGKGIANCSVNNDLSDVKLSPRDNQIYISAYVPILYILDVSSCSFAQANVTFPEHSWIAFSLDGNILYACLDEGCTGITAYNASTWEVVGISIPLLVNAGLDLEVGPDGNVYLLSSDGIYVINGTADQNQYLNGLGFLTGSFTNDRGAFSSSDMIFVPVLSSEEASDSGDGANQAVAIGAGVGAGGGALLVAGVSAVFVAKRKKNKGKSDSDKYQEEPTYIEAALPIEVKNTEPVTPTEKKQNSHPQKPAEANQGTPAEMQIFVEAQKPVDAQLHLSSQAIEMANSMFHQYWEIDFDELEIETEIGRGAFGSVYRGEWRNSVCVVKQLQQGLITLEAITNFLKEANTVKTLRTHKNVCPIFGVCTNPEKPICIVMEYCNGGNLQAALNQKKIKTNFNNLIKIFKDICSGMSHVHREGIIHCDLACRNCLVAFEGSGGFSIKITDFGLARTLPKEGYLRLIDQDVFPIRWSAPELLNERLASKAGDVWSFGVVMWETIQGETPFAGMTNLQVIEHVAEKRLHLGEPYRVRAGQLPKSLYDIMQKCWKFDPTKRATFDDLIKDFKNLDKDQDLKNQFTQVTTTTEMSNSTFYSEDFAEAIPSQATPTVPSDDKYVRYSKITRPTSPSMDLTYGNKYDL